MKLTLSAIFIIILSAGCNFTSQNPYKNTQKVFYIVEMGKVRLSDKKLVVNSLRNFYNATIEFLPKIEIVKSAKVTGQNKYRASDILNYMKSKYPDIDGKILVLTKVDICTNRNLHGKTYQNWGILGLAFMNENYCVVSTKRISDHSRLAKVAVHEIGHTLGLNHCDTPKCVMKDANGKASTIDGVDLQLCDKCKNEIYF